MKVGILKKSRQRGFKAVEMLVVLALLAIVASMVIPRISTVTGEVTDGQTNTGSADTVKDQNNAQNIVSMGSAVAALGGNLPGTKSGCINSLLAGTNVVFAGGTNHYQLGGMSAEDVAGAGRYIEYTNTGTPRLVFHPEGGQ